MSTLELKNSIISKINTIEDEKFLKEIIEIINGASETKNILFQNYNNEIQKSLDDYKLGQTVSHNMVKEEIDSWKNQ